jgi:hypothetical protein
LPDVSLYDFRYPEAQIKIIIDEKYGGTDTFRYLLPGSFTIVDTFWSHAIFTSSSSLTSYSTMSIDDVQVDSISRRGGWGCSHGDLDESQQVADIYHTVSVSGTNYGTGYAAIVLLYNE